MTLEEAAARTGRSVDLLRRWARDGRVPASKVGRDWFIAEPDLPAIDAMPRRQRPLRLSVTPSGPDFIAILRSGVGSRVEAPAGLEVTYRGAMEYRGVDIAPILDFSVIVAATAAGNLLSDWIERRFGGGKATKVTLDRREITFGKNGNVKKVVEERLRARRGRE